jgi:hypothetical protein
MFHPFREPRAISNFTEPEDALPGGPVKLITAYVGYREGD